MRTPGDVVALQVAAGVEAEVESGLAASAVQAAVLAHVRVARLRSLVRPDHRHRVPEARIRLELVDAFVTDGVLLAAC